MFIDRAKIYLQSGKGGDGAVSFRKEKYVEFGGPDGGNGGRGGSIYFVSKDGINTLSNYRHAIKVKANNGDNGHKKNSFGKAAEDVYLTVPTGTVIYDENNNILADLNKPNMEYLACIGGKGGKGNKCFATSTNRTPRIAENGQPGESKTLILELKLLADVGLVGLPSVGKSSLLSVISNAKPKVASYHFTTLEPMLGTVRLSDNEDFVVADLPGLIEGASKGKGLGYVFLRHIERCRVIIHVVDVSYETGDPLSNFEMINNELFAYSEKLKTRPMIIALNKMDVQGNKEKASEFIQKLNEKYPNKYKIIEISTFSKEGIKELLRTCYDTLKDMPKESLYDVKDNNEDVITFTPKTKTIFKVFRHSPNHFEIVGDELIKKYRSINMKGEDGMMKFMAYLNSLNINEELKRLGAKSGSIVRLDDFEFEYTED